MQPRLNHHVDPSTETLLQVNNQARRKERGSIGSDVDENVDVAVRLRIPTRHGTKDTHIPSTVTGSDSKDLGALLPQNVVDAHVPPLPS